MKFKDVIKLIKDDFEVFSKDKGLLESYSSFFCGESEYNRIVSKYGEYEVLKIRSDYDTFDIRIIIKD